MKRSVFLLSLFVSACASSTGPVPTGVDSYMLSATNYGPVGGVGALKAQAFREAAAFCETKGKVFVPTSGTDRDRVIGQRFPESEVHFLCLDRNDPQAQRANLRKEPDVRIEDARKP